jgi:antitoxin component YwqK of YwqJK toxin-antitoxin module
MCREWYESGRLAAVHRFAKGEEDGLQEGWSPAGEVVFSYDMRGGRRYGLLGAMNCKTGARAPGAL